MTVVSTVLLYGAESWALTSDQEQRLAVFHHQRLRMILGVRLADRVSRERLYEMCGCPPISTLLARRQLRWLGHIGRMGEARITRQVLHSTMWQPDRRRQPGRQPPRIRPCYKSLVDEHMPRRVLTDHGLGRRATWLDAAGNRSLFRNLLP